MEKLAVIGDIHGDCKRLEEVLGLPSLSDRDRIIFTGDYINRGPDSRRVIDLLVELSTDPRYTFLRGNHEDELLRAFETNDIAPVLRMGGAPTIRSYVQTPVGGDVFAEFRDHFPRTHLRWLLSLSDIWSKGDVLVTHRDFGPNPRYRIFGHSYCGDEPDINGRRARIDTGCGTGGRLSAFFWPEMTFSQTS